VEAQSVALLCCESLGLCGVQPGLNVRSWTGLQEMPERSAQEIFRLPMRSSREGRRVRNLCRNVYESCTLKGPRWVISEVESGFSSHRLTARCPLSARKDEAQVVSDAMSCG